ncbi:MAG: hypothetical protein CGU28_12935 [Candidatus Dactylopiibacterium carminicum]|nr:MAG: hypothetical protein CGU28_12935 [Candidatus Dactylopiibacterium carminicum]
MLRRFDSLFRLFLTLLGAVLLALVVEAEGLRTWADRLAVGPLRSVSLPVAEAWADAVRPLGFSRPRAVLLAGKDALTPLFAPALEQAEAVVLTGPAVVIAPKPVQDMPEPASVPEPVPVGSWPLAAPELPRAPSRSIAVMPTGEGVAIALAGDSMMAVGLAPALTRGLGSDKRLHLVRAFRSGTGLARPEVFDWLERYPLMVAERPPRLVICAMGANDAQNVQVGRDVLRFGSEAWDAFYLERLDRFLALITANDTRVLWVGMPVMREKGFSRRMAHMNALVQQALQAHPSVQWLDPNPALGYVDNAFAQYRANARGKLVKLRADDGIHMTDEGAGFLVEPIRDWIETAQLQTPTLGSQHVLPLTAALSR